jgi:hypothetical protein
MRSQLVLLLSPALLALWLPLAHPDLPELEQTPVFADSGASVRLARGGGCTMISTDGTVAYGLTAAHCVGKKGSKIGVILDGKTVIGRVVAVDGEQDLALVRVVTSYTHVAEFTTGPNRYTFSTLNERGRYTLSVESAGESRWDTVNKRLYYRRVFQVHDGVCRAGDSGTGVFQGDSLVGVVTHGSKRGDSKVLMSPTQSVVREFLHETQKMVPLGGDYRSWGDKDRTREILEIKKRLLELETSGTGKQGPPGPAGPAGSSGDNTAALVARIEELETWKRNFRAIVRVRVTPRE